MNIRFSNHCEQLRVDSSKRRQNYLSYRLIHKLVSMKLIDTHKAYAKYVAVFYLNETQKLHILLAYEADQFERNKAHITVISSMVDESIYIFKQEPIANRIMMGDISSFEQKVYGIDIPKIAYSYVKPLEDATDTMKVGKGRVVSKPMRGIKVVRKAVNGVIERGKSIA